MVDFTVDGKYLYLSTYFSASDNELYKYDSNTNSYTLHLSIPHIDSWGSLISDDGSLIIHGGASVSIYTFDGSAVSSIQTLNGIVS